MKKAALDFHVAPRWKSAIKTSPQKKKPITKPSTARNPKAAAAETRANAVSIVGEIAIGVHAQAEIVAVVEEIAADAVIFVVAAAEAEAVATGARDPSIVEGNAEAKLAPQRASPRPNRDLTIRTN